MVGALTRHPSKLRACQRKFECYNSAMKAKLSFDCGCCSHQGSRREFLKTTVTGVAALAAAGPLTGMAAHFEPAKVIANRIGTPETLVGALHKTLTEEQRKAICFPFEHPLRSKVDNNWFITDKKIGSSFFTKDQRQMVKDIFHDLNSPKSGEPFYRRVDHDGGKEVLGPCPIALSENPAPGEFELVWPAPHSPRRCDGDSVAGAAFGG